MAIEPKAEPEIYSSHRDDSLLMAVLIRMSDLSVDCLSNQPPSPQAPDILDADIYVAEGVLVEKGEYEFEHF